LDGMDARVQLAPGIYFVKMINGYHVSDSE
jgi:hypothetical protein